MAGRMLFCFQDCNKLEVTPAPPCRVGCLGWLKPPADTLKLNVNASGDLGKVVSALAQRFATRMALSLPAYPGECLVLSLPTWQSVLLCMKDWNSRNYVT